MPTGPGETSRSSAAVTPLGGVRADFVANLGRRLAELRQHFAAFENAPSAARARDEVRRRLHALTTRARLLEFSAMADRLDEAQLRLDQAGAGGSLSSAELGWFHDLFRALPQLAWGGAAPPPEPSAELAPPAPAAPALPAAELPTPLAAPPSLISVLVVGPEALARALNEPGSRNPSTRIECESAEDLKVAQVMARALAPDLVVVDIDLPGASGFISALAEDPLTEPVPVLALGNWSHPEQASGLMSLGVVRCLAKPVPPDVLRDAVEQAVTAGAERAPFDIAPMGELTVDEVADRLAAQLRAALVLSVRPDARNFKVPLGEGTELLAAVWSAVARVRETLTIRSNGNVRFSSSGPAGAVPLAPWMDETRLEPPPRRTAGREPDDQGDKVRLEGRRVLVVDDDPAITWFLSGILRASGAFVYEAHNGRRALEQAFRSTPDLVITDIIMPELDGFGLCRELKRDIALRDAPVILLSWKEDLLQRVRELGARADGYIKKESSAPAILRRVQEVLQPRSRIEARLRAGGEVRGRLDGLTARTLLQLIAGAMPEARLTLRDANYVYEVELREGAPRAASRTAQDGSFERGPGALASMLGLAAGRFHVAASRAPLRATLQGDLASQLNPFIARVRAAQRLLTGDALLRVRAVRLSLAALMLEALPANARAALEQLHAGASPRELILSRGEAPAVLEALLDDAAIRGAIEEILGDDGAELLQEETARTLEAMRAPLRSMRPPRLAGSPSTPAPPVQPVPSEPAAAATPAPSPPAPEPAQLQTPSPELAGHAAPEQQALEPAAQGRCAPHAAAWRDEAGTPTSLTEAVIREVLDPNDQHVPTARAPKAMLEVELKPRTVQPLTGNLPSLPPGAVVPAREAVVEVISPAEPSVPGNPSLPPIWPGDVPISPEQGEHKPTGQPLNPRTWVSGKAPPQPKEDGEQGSAADEELRVPTRSLALPIALATLVVAGLIAAGVWLKLPIEQQRASAAPSGSASVAASVPTAAPAPEVTPPEPAASVSASAAPALSASASPASSEADEDPDDDDSVVPPP